MKLGSLDTCIRRGVRAAVSPADSLNVAVRAHVASAADLVDAFMTTARIAWPARAESDYIRSVFEEDMRGAMLGHLEIAAKYGGLELAGVVQFVEMPFGQAVRYFRGKRVLDAEAFDRMETAHRRAAAAIAEDHAAYVKERLRESLRAAIDEGATKAKWVSEASAEMEKWGVTPTARHHMETTFETTVADANAKGRMDQQLDPDVLEEFPFWVYRTAGDERVRPTHREMEGWIARADAPVWEIWYPPNGFNCRCSVEVLDASEGADAAIEDMPSVMPDEGFEHKPGMLGA